MLMTATGRRVVSGGRKRNSADSGIRRVRLENDQRKAQLLELGRSEFARRSYDEVSIDDIANAAGISKGLLYHYFPTKRDLYIAGLRATAGHLLAHMETKVSDSETNLEKALSAYLEYAAANRESYVALMNGGIGSDPEVSEVVATTRSIFWRTMELDPEAVDLSHHAWVGALEGVTLAWIVTDALDRDVVVAMLLAMREAALASRSS